MNNGQLVNPEGEVDSYRIEGLNFNEQLLASNKKNSSIDMEEFL